MTTTTELLADFEARHARSPAASRYTDAELEILYAMVHGLYQQGNFEKAASFFSVLTLYRPTSVRFLKGLAASRFMSRSFEAAVSTYAFLVMLQPHDLEAQCMYGNSLLMAGELGEARKVLRGVAAAEEGDLKFKDRAKALLALIGH